MTSGFRSQYGTFKYFMLPGFHPDSLHSSFPRHDNHLLMSLHYKPSHLHRLMVREFWSLTDVSDQTDSIFPSTDNQHISSDKTTHHDSMWQVGGPCKVPAESVPRSLAYIWVCAFSHVVFGCIICISFLFHLDVDAWMANQSLYDSNNKTLMKFLLMHLEHVLIQIFPHLHQFDIEVTCCVSKCEERFSGEINCDVKHDCSLYYLSPAWIKRIQRSCVGALLFLVDHTVTDQVQVDLSKIMQTFLCILYLSISVW